MDNPLNSWTYCQKDTTFESPKPIRLVIDCLWQYMFYRISKDLYSGSHPT